MADINRDAPRFLRAVQLVNNAETLFNDNQLPGALLLYVAALEMIGWEVNLPFGIEELGRRIGLRDKHRLRHFSAAALFVADCLLVFGERVIAEVDFKRLTFERRSRSGDQQPGVGWAPKGDTLFMSMLGNMVNPVFPINNMIRETPQYDAVMNLRSGMTFLGSAALGFLDNHRLALIHEDNDFDFIQFNDDGTSVAGRSLDLPITVENYMRLLPRIVESAGRPEVMNFLSSRLQDMVISFQAPLKERSYSSTKV